MNSEHIKSKQRVADHGEVFTNHREVSAMLDLVKAETERIESRFLEPACGNGNFLAEVLVRKLFVVKNKYKSSQLEYERYSILAISSVYGIDILPDNIDACRTRLFDLFEADYKALFKSSIKDSCLAAARYILDNNIVLGDALTLRTVDSNPRSIIFPEWSPVNGSLIKRRDFMFAYLVEEQHQISFLNDEGNDARLSEPVKEYPAVHFLELGNA